MQDTRLHSVRLDVKQDIPRHTATESFNAFQRHPNDDQPWISDRMLVPDTVRCLDKAIHDESSNFTKSKTSRNSNSQTGISIEASFVFTAFV